MASLKNTTINDTGFITLPKGDNSTRPVSGVTSGMTRYNTNSNVIEFYNGSNWVGIGLLDGSSSSTAAASATAIKNLTGTTTSGYFWIAPAGNGPVYTYCDMSGDGGGWMLMINARPGNGGQYYSDANDYNLTALGPGTAAEFNKSTTSKISTAKINWFFQISGFKYGRMTPNTAAGFTIDSPFTGLYQRIGTTTSARWADTLFDCANRGSLTNSTYDWVLRQFKSWTDVQNNTDGQTGSYTGGSHYYPTTYDNAYQNFWKGDQDGIRFSKTFRGENYSSTGQNTCAGYFWIRTS
jgi:hypothetical protein